jgi:hypothetical protein
MPIDYKKYPANWKTEIRPAILLRANNCCEECGVANYATGARDTCGNWHSSKEICNMNSDVGYGYFGTYGVRDIKIVLTIAHLDHDINNNDHSNLKALCQRCHLRLDIGLHRKNAKETIRKKKGLQNLF